MKKFIILLCSVAMFSCGDDTPETPQCVLDDLAEFQTTTACIGDNLASWEFDGETVYCFAFGTCTSVGVAEIYDENCTLLCTLGGANQLTTCNGIEWATNASNEQTIWRKDN